MQHIDIILTRAPADGLAAYAHEQLSVAFHLLDRTSDLPLLEGAVWIFIDWVLPNISGLEVCRRLRCDPLTAKARITMVLDQDDLDARRRALRAGADDYLIGSPTRRMLLDRALSSLGSITDFVQRQSLSMGELTIELTAFQARWRGQPIRLMPNEFRLLRFFVEHPGRVFTRQQLIQALGKHDAPIDERTVDVWIGRLRRALAGHGVSHELRTVRSLGYVLDTN